jgi:hypothetical protein
MCPGIHDGMRRSRRARGGESRGRRRMAVGRGDRRQERRQGVPVDPPGLRHRARRDRRPAGDPREGGLRGSADPGGGGAREARDRLHRARGHRLRRFRPRRERRRDLPGDPGPAGGSQRLRGDRAGAVPRDRPQRRRDLRVARRLLDARTLLRRRRPARRADRPAGAHGAADRRRRAHPGHHGAVRVGGQHEAGRRAPRPVGAGRAARDPRALGEGAGERAGPAGLHTFQLGRAAGPLHGPVHREGRGGADPAGATGGV